MKKILIYGDSNTFGESPFSENERLASDVRWTGLLAQELASKAEVYEEGFSGRTAADLQSGREGDANGQMHFSVVYGSHKPVDVVIIALGTNDLQKRFNQSAEQIFDSLDWYQREAKRLDDTEAHFTMPAFLYVIPPKFEEDDRYFVGGLKTRERLAKLMKEQFTVVDESEITLSKDGVHFSPQGHRKMFELVSSKLEDLL